MRFALLAMLVIVSLSACSSRNEDKLLHRQPWGAPFTTQLAEEYRQFQVVDARKVSADSYFAEKGRYTNQGRVLEPERLEYWDLGQYRDELVSARSRLVMAFAYDARALVPQPAAVAQANFDCWVDAAHAGNEPKVRECRNRFEDAMMEIEAVLGPLDGRPRPVDGLNGPRNFREPPPPPPAPAPAPRAPAFVPSDDAIRNGAVTPDFIIYFAFDSASIDQQGLNQLDEVVKTVQDAEQINIRLIGHTDTAGPGSYNDSLSMRRAQAVKSVMVNSGVEANRINILAKGENELAKQTPDETPERLNRRAEIFIANPESLTRTGTDSSNAVKAPAASPKQPASPPPAVRDERPYSDEIIPNFSGTFGD